MGYKAGPVTSGHATQATVDLDALAHNHAVLARRAGTRALIAVVKADAYGHGAAAVARRLAREGCRAFAVASVAEAAELRGRGIDAALLVLGGPRDADEARTALELAAVPVLHGEQQAAHVAEAARALGVRAAVHVEIDTGMRRLGVPAEAAPAFLAGLARRPELALEGVSTHFARADEPDLEPQHAQLALFRRVLAEARAGGVRPGCVHVANSAALLASAGDPALVEGDAVRPGLALYGVAPAPHLADGALRPVMTLRTTVLAIRKVAAGEGVGYGHAWVAPRSGWVATLPIGYADGIPWSAAAGGSIWIRGARRPLAGRVSMDLLTVWTGDEPPGLGEEAVVFGTSGEGKRIAVEELAAAAGTIPYELLVRVGARVPRVVAEQGAQAGGPA
jgi:alanine racemase